MKIDSSVSYLEIPAEMASSYLALLIQHCLNVEKLYISHLMYLYFTYL